MLLRLAVIMLIWHMEVEIFGMIPTKFIGQSWAMGQGRSKLKFCYGWDKICSPSTNSF